MDRAFGWVGSGLSVVLDLIFWPFEQLSRGIVRLFAVLSAPLKAGRSAADRARPLLKRSQREQLGLVGRVLLMLPLLFFVLFPFYWIIITSFKTDLQIQSYDSIFWPNPGHLSSL